MNHLQELDDSLDGWQQEDAASECRRERSRQREKRLRKDPVLREQANARKRESRRRAREAQLAGRAAEMDAERRRRERLVANMIEDVDWLVKNYVQARYIPARVTNPVDGQPFRSTGQLDQALRRAGRNDLAEHFWRRSPAASVARDSLTSA
jgi:hypothetical protein